MKKLSAKSRLQSTNPVFSSIDVVVTSQGLESVVREDKGAEPSAQQAPQTILGFLDSCTDTEISGWMIREGTSYAYVDVYADSDKIATLACNLIRGDVADAGYSSAVCGFYVETPEELKDGQPRLISVRCAETGTELNGSPLELCVAPANEVSLKKLAASSDELLNRLFDPAWYLRENPDVAASGMDPLEHFVQHGQFEFRDPSPLFISKWYAQHYPEYKKSGLSPVFHYLSVGAANGAHPNAVFDDAWYRTTYLLSADESALVHYVEHGAAEGRNPHPLFDTEWYMRRNSDIPLSWMDPAAHYVRHGALEMRDPHPLFRTRWYVKHFDNLNLAETSALTHYVEHGASSATSPHPLFDQGWYRQHYDLPAASNPLVDYLQHGSTGARDPNPLFNSQWYLQQNPGVLKERLNPLVHYMLYGAAAGLDPNPFFDSAWYVEEYPYIRAAGISPLEHYLNFPVRFRRQEASLDLFGDEAAADRQNSVDTIRGPEFLSRSIDFGFARRAGTSRHITAAVLAYEHLSKIDAELRSAMTATGVLKLLPCTGLPGDRKFHAWKAIFKLLKTRYQKIVFAPWLTLGGADLVAVNAVKAAQEELGIAEVLLVLTDHDRRTADHWLPPGTEIISFSEVDPALSPDERTELVATLIHATQPTAVLNVNSRAAWEATERYGQAMSSFTKLFACLFCRDYNIENKPDGYADRFFRTCLPHVARIYFDSQRFLSELEEEYYVPAVYREKLSVLYSPAPLEIPRWRPNEMSEEPRRIIWAGRNCRQKNTDLLLKIIRACPDMQFDVYGDFDDEFFRTDGRGAAPNAHLLGTFQKFEDLPLSRYAAFLFTSIFEGIPTMLINAAAAGIPLVASDVGGISELVDDETGWLIRDHLESQPYIAALQEILMRPDLVTQRIGAMHKRVAEQHTWVSFTNAFSTPASSSFVG